MNKPTDTQETGKAAELDELLDLVAESASYGLRSAEQKRYVELKESIEKRLCAPLPPIATESEAKYKYQVECGDCGSIWGSNKPQFNVCMKCVDFTPTKVTEAPNDRT